MSATENELSIWLSTYGLITAERILEHCEIHLQQEELMRAIKNPNNFYYHLLRIPLKNVFNGIILQQASDYQVYAQKLFIDYLISGESGKPEEAPGGEAREDLEKERKILIRMADDFYQCEMAHNKLIAESQKSLMNHSAEWKEKLSEAAKKLSDQLHAYEIDKDEETITRAVNSLLIFQDLKGNKVNLKDDIWLDPERILGVTPLSTDVKQAFIDQINALQEFTTEIEFPLRDFVHKTNEMSAKLRQWRFDFQEFILRVNTLIQHLPEYHYDPTQNQENREALYFNADLGEEKKS